ncbi:MAG: hypothetical protein A3E01_09315 [Gammaproteobacteria bacterium RIFCSPHIGHO2_12_FULL_63_22]|nr:MAG: hypothetical protein A3E01_09315 [Gammaproteobacteria bacterium RIFCSPHIGHO2_12_FULL_63_22]
MNALQTIEPDQVFEGWVEAGRSLANQRRNVDWQIGDWMVEGREKGFLSQAGFDFLSENLGMTPKRLKDIARAAEAFPAHMRDASLSIDHHASVADIEPQLRIDFLSRAKQEHWTPEQVRHEAHHASEPRQLNRGHDAMLESFIRHWNRLPRPARLEAAEMIAQSHGDEIEP